MTAQEEYILHLRRVIKWADASGAKEIGKWARELLKREKEKKNAVPTTH